MTFDEHLAKQLEDPEFAKLYKSMEPDYETIGQLFDARREQRLTQKDLAERTGIPQAHISRLENGNYNPSLAFLKRVAAGLGKEIHIEFRPYNVRSVFPGEKEKNAGYRKFSELRAKLPPDAQESAKKKSEIYKLDIKLENIRKVRRVAKKTIADRVGVKQPSLAQMEKEDDLHLSSLKKLVEAMEGSLNISADFPGGVSYKLYESQAEEPELSLRVASSVK